MKVSGFRRPFAARRSAVVAVGAVLALALGVSACGGSTGQQSVTSPTTSTATGTKDGGTPATIAVPTGTVPPGDITVGPSGTGTGSTGGSGSRSPSTTAGSGGVRTSVPPDTTPVITSPPSSTAPPTTQSPRVAEDAVATAYNTFNVDLTDLEYNFEVKWIKAMYKVADDQLIQTTEYAAAEIKAHDDRGEGQLQADHEVVKVHGTTATVRGCLNEKTWHLVNTVTGDPEPSVARGYFVGTASAVDHDGSWYLTKWSSDTTRCSY